MGQEYWSGLPFPPLEDLPDPGIKPASPASAGDFFTTKDPVVGEDGRQKEKEMAEDEMVR